jgi:DNA-binding transcriptional MocR family regulator
MNTTNINYDLRHGDIMPTWMTKMINNNKINIENNTDNILNILNKFINDYSVIELKEDNSNIEIIHSDELILINSIITGLMTIINYLKYKKNVKKVYIEELTQYKIIKLFHILNLSIDTFNFNNLDELNTKIIIDKANNIQSMIYIIPFCNVPNGITITCDELYQLINIITTNSIFMLSDELYFMLQFTNTKLNPLAYYCKNIITINSFSKILSSKIKVGWIYLRNKELMKELNEYILNIGLNNPVNNNFICDILESNKLEYYKLLSILKQNLLSKVNVIISIIAKYPNYFTYDIPHGGHYILVRTLKVNSLCLCDICKKNNITIISALEYTNTKDINLLNYYKDYIVMSYSFYDLTYFKTIFEYQIKNIICDIDSYCKKI